MKEIYHCGPDDPRITEMDPVQKLWMFHQWIGDQLDQAELAKNQAYLLASFDHPEEVKKLMGDGADFHTSTEEEFDESSRIVKQYSLQTLKQKSENKKGKRKRKATLQPSSQ